MSKATPHLLVVSACLAIVSSHASEIVTVPMTLSLDPPAATAPGINHLSVGLNGGIIGSDSDSSKLTGTVQAVVRINVDDPDNPFVVGLQFVSGDVSFEDTSFNLFTLFISDIDVAGVGVGASVFTPSGNPEPVTANAFDATLHNIDINRGTLTATGTAVGNPVNEVQDLSVNPLTGPASGVGGTSVVKLPSSTPISYDYQFAVSLPISFVAPIPVNPSVTITATVNGTIAAKGLSTVVILPKLRALGMAPGGFQLEATGKPGASVLLKWSDDLAGGWNPIGTVTLPTPVITDAGAIGKPRRFYRFEEP